MVRPNDIDLLNPPAEIEKRRHKLKHLVQSPNSFFMDVRCLGCFNMFQQNMATYQNLITQLMYDKQLDSGRGTLLHSCDDVIRQEVKEVIFSFFILMEQGKLTVEELDLWCKELIKEEFGEACNFDVVDAVQMLEKLGIVSRDSLGRVYCVGLKRANEIIGTTTEELVLKAGHGTAA